VSTQASLHNARLAAIELRRSGATYQAIRGRFGIAKSTVWRWLKAEGLVDGQSQQYTERRLLAQKKAAETVRRIRVERTAKILAQARAEVGALSRRDLWLIGTGLYWAEGAKQKDRNGAVSEQVVFSNTDPRMHRLFVRFLKQCCGIEESALTFRVYLHETAEAGKARTYWSEQLGIKRIEIAPITWKRHKPTVFRSNIGERYHGLLRIVVRGSTDLNRRIAGWIEGLCTDGEWCNGSTGPFGGPRPGPSPGSPAIVADGHINRLSQIGDMTCDGPLGRSLLKELIAS